MQQFQKQIGKVCWVVELQTEQSCVGVGNETASVPMTDSDHDGVIRAQEDKIGAGSP